MTQNIIEYARQLSIEKLFQTDGFKNVWPTWKQKINTEYLTNEPTPKQILNLGDHLREIFRATNNEGRTQSTISSGGAVWESLICWFLNLCTTNRNTFVIKHNKDLIPKPIADAITVNYGNFKSNTESDLIAITFPDKPEYKIDKYNIKIKNSNNEIINMNSKKYPYLDIINALTDRDFEDIEIHIIQCKTNWNDNAQIPMLWDAVYAANKFKNNITVGTNNYSIQDIKKFTYSFVTVPTNKLEKNGKETYKISSTAVLRVTNLSGGNYWGLPSKTGIAKSVKELIETNLKSGNNQRFTNTLAQTLEQLNTTFKYFDL